MQKKLIVAAVAAAVAVPAFAQNQVTISGIMVGGYEQAKAKNLPAGRTADTYDAVADQSSRIIFSGVEDLGGGLKGHFQIDFRFRIDENGGNGADGNTGLGLMGGWGKLTVGKWDLHYPEGYGLMAISSYSLQLLGTHGILSQNNGAAIAVTSRSQNVIKYDTPAMGGFGGTVAYSTDPLGTECTNNAAANSANDCNGAAWTAALRYAGGPIMAGVSFWNMDAESNAVGDQRSIRAWVGGTFAGFRVGVLFDQNKLERTVGGVTGKDKRNAWYIPVMYKLGNIELHAQYGKAGNLSGGPTAGGSTGAKFWTVGADYRFSKRTSMGVFYSKMDNESNGAYRFFAASRQDLPSAGLTGVDYTQFYIGARHNF